MAQPIRILALSIVPGSFCFAGAAMADPLGGVDLATSASVATNPFQEVEGRTSGSGSLQISPWVKLEGAKSHLEFNSQIDLSHYTNSYGTDTAASVRLDAGTQLSSRIGLSAGGSFLTTRRLLHSLLTTAAPPSEGLPPPTTSLPDISFGGLDTRSDSFDAYLGASFQLGAGDSLTLSAGGGGTRLDSFGSTDYNTYHGGADFAHRLSDRVSATAGIAVSKSNYIHTDAGDGTVVSPRAGANFQFSERAKLSVSLGASFSKSTLFDGSTDSFTIFSGDIRFCNAWERASLCMTASRGAQPTAVGGVSAVSNLSLSYDRQLGERTSLALTGQYAKTTGPNDSEYYGAWGTLTRRFGRRLSGFVSPSYYKFTGVVPRDANFQVDVGLRISFGDR